MRPYWPEMLNKYSWIFPCVYFLFFRMKYKTKRLLLVPAAAVIILFTRKGFHEFLNQNDKFTEISSFMLNTGRDSVQDKMMDNRAILTLFTTFKESHNKSYIHRNTIRNWGLLSPDVVPVLFTGLNVPSNVVDYARQQRWRIFPAPRISKSGIPVLRHMFLEAQRLFNTTFYAYANSDILFDRNLTDTLYELIRLKKNLTSILVVGRRRNWEIKWQQCISNLEEIGHYAKSTKLFKTHAKDYFISIRNGYPWNTIPDFVVGRIAYDSWLLVTALKTKIPLVDATETITALHQTDSRGGEFEGFKASTERNLNLNLAKRNFPFIAGRTSCAHFSTRRFNGLFTIKETIRNGKKCHNMAIPYVRNPFHISWYIMHHLLRLFSNCLDMTWAPCHQILHQFQSGNSVNKNISGYQIMSLTCSAIWNIDFLPANAWTFIHFHFYIYTKDLNTHWQAIFCICL